jgi:hypothetical protein
MSKRCKEIRSLFDQLLDGDLAEQELSGVRKHLADCTACRSELQKEKEIITLFERLPELPCPESVHRAVRQNTFDRERSTAPVQKGTYRSRAFRWRLAYAGLAAAVIALLLIWTPLNQWRRPVQITYSPEEMQRTQTQARWSLLFTVATLNRTQKETVEAELIERLPSTLRKGIRSATQTI